MSEPVIPPQKSEFPPPIGRNAKRIQRFLLTFNYVIVALCLVALAGTAWAEGRPRDVIGFCLFAAFLVSFVRWFRSQPGDTADPAPDAQTQDARTGDDTEY